MMKLARNSLLFVFLMSWAPSLVRGALILEAAWVEEISAAGAATGGAAQNSDAEGRAGLGVTLSRSAFASAASTSASASTTAHADFNGASAFAVDLSLGLFTSAGIFPVAAAKSSFILDFRVEGQSENRPVWSLSNSSFSSSTLQYGFAHPLPTFSLINRNSGANAGGTLTPGSYRATVYINLLDNHDSDGGTTTWTSAGVLTVGAASTSPGFNQANPLPPQSHDQSGFTFTNAPSGRWIDPPVTDGYTFRTTDGSNFTDILNFPSGFDSDFSVVVGDQVLGSFGAGDSVNFQSLVGHDVSEFQIVGISPGVDTEDPVGFPIQLAFSNPTASFTMTAIPEPSTALFGAIGVLLLCFRRGRTF